MSDHVCDKVLTIQTHSSQIDELFNQGRDRERRLTEIDTELHGTSRNGGGWFAMHQRQHEEAEVELKETMEVLRVGLSTMANQVTDLSAQVKVICDKKSGWRRVIEVALPALITAGLAFAAVMVAK